MSADTLAAIEAAIHAHVADTHGQVMVTDWILAHGHISLNGEDSGYGYAASPTTPWAALGLLQLASASLDADLAEEGE